MQTLENSLSQLIVDGVITYEDAMAITARPKEMIRTLEQMNANVARV